jgi:hypothetical protein
MENDLSRITSLRTLRTVRYANERARMAARERIKNRVDEVFSLSGLFFALFKEYTPLSIKSVVERVFSCLKE